MNTLTATMTQPAGLAGLPSRSLGMKLILVSVLALIMAIPTFFVGGLVQERSRGTADTVETAPTQTLAGLPIRVVDSYRSVNRSLKYVLLFLGLVFGTYFVFEATTGKKVHPAQYVLVGMAQLIFYLLLLSLSEKISFDEAFLFAGTSTVSLLSINAGWVFGARTQMIRGFIVFSLLYVLIFLLLRVEQDALLIGAISSFIVVASLMYFTRQLDWYDSLATLAAPAKQYEAMPAAPQS